MKGEVLAVSEESLSGDGSRWPRRGKVKLFMKKNTGVGRGKGKGKGREKISCYEEKKRKTEGEEERERGGETGKED